MKKIKTVESYKGTINSDILFELLEVPDHINEFWLHTNNKHMSELPYIQIIRGEECKFNASFEVEVKE